MKPWCAKLYVGMLLATSVTNVAWAEVLPSRFDLCGEGEPKRRIRIAIMDEMQDLWNVILTTNGRNEPARVSTYIFANTKPRDGFLMAILPKAKTPPLLIFDDGHAEWAGRFYFTCQ